MSTTKHENKLQFFTFAIRPNGGLSTSQYNDLHTYLTNISDHPNVLFWSLGLETTCNTANYCNASTRHCHVTILLKEPKRTRFIRIPSLDKDYNRTVLGAKHKINYVQSRDLATVGYSIKGFHYFTYGMTPEFIQECHDAWNAKDKSLSSQIDKRVVVSRNNYTQIVCTHAHRLRTKDFDPNLMQVIIDMVRSKEYTFTMINYQQRGWLEYNPEIISDDAILEVFTNKIRGDEFQSLNRCLYSHGIDITGQDIPIQPQPYTGNTSISYPKPIGGTLYLGSTTESPPSVRSFNTTQTDSVDYLFSDPEDVQNDLDLIYP